MKKTALIFLGLAFLTATGAALASSDNQYGKAKTPPFPQPAEKELQKVVFIRYAPGYYRGLDKPCNHDGVCDPDEKGWCDDCRSNEEPTPTPEPGSSCYDFLSGAKPRWNWPENYYYSQNDLGQASSWATGVWNSATAAAIFGEGIQETHSWGQYDYINSISYGNYAEPYVIGVTAIWFQGKKIYEYDIMFDTDYFPESGFDLNTVALHEFGHAAGLNDLYNTECREEVMYGYLDEEEIRSELGRGDLTGIQALYN